MLLDDAGGHLAGGVQRIDGEQGASDRGYVQQRPHRCPFAVAVVKVGLASGTPVPCSTSVAVS